MKGEKCTSCAYNDEGSCSCFEPEEIECPYASGTHGEFKQYLVRTLSKDYDHCDLIERYHVITAQSEDS